MRYFTKMIISLALLLSLPFQGIPSKGVFYLSPRSVITPIPLNEFDLILQEVRKLSNSRQVMLAYQQLMPFDFPAELDEIVDEIKNQIFTQVQKQTIKEKKFSFDSFFELWEKVMLEIKKDFLYEPLSEQDYRIEPRIKNNLILMEVTNRENPENKLFLKMHCTSSNFIQLVQETYIAETFHVKFNGTDKELRKKAERVTALNSIKKLLLYEEHGEEYYLVQLNQYLEGEELQLYIKKNQTDLLTTLSIFEQLLEGAIFFRKAGLLHQDISDQNILIHNGKIRFMDFGFSLFYDSYKERFDSGQVYVIGQYPFISPSVMYGYERTFQDDLWSIGIIFYKLMTQKLPFSKEADDEKFYQEVENKYPILKESFYQKDPVRKRIANIINKMLSPDKLNQFQSAEDILKEIGKIRKDYGHRLLLRDLFNPNQLASSL